MSRFPLRHVSKHASWYCLLAAAAILFLSWFSHAASAQAARKLTVPKPEVVTLNTRDGVQIHCTYYPGGVVSRVDEEKKQVDPIKKSGKEVVPVILIHGWGGKRIEYSPLAGVLQKQGHAVIIPDLRGHGSSTKRRLPNGAEVPLDRERMRPGDLQGMLLDIEAVKKFLLEKNNEGEVNIEQLTVVGAEFGAIIALNWAQLDWSRRQLPSFKQGQDVKALILLSPELSFRGFSTNSALQHPVVSSQLSMMIIAGNEDRRGYNDARSLHKRLERLHRDPPTPADEDLFLFDLDTSLAGTRLVDPRARLNADKLIVTFIERRLISQKSYLAWRERKNPLEFEE